MPFELPPLPYAYDGLEPYIDEETMHLHHDKHHQAYVNNLNAATEGTSFNNMSIDELVRNLNLVPEDKRTAVRNNGGGHYNHSMFWEIMKPGGGASSRCSEAADARVRGTHHCRCLVDARPIVGMDTDERVHLTVGHQHHR